MKNFIITAVIFLMCSSLSSVSAQNSDSIAIRRIYNDALSDSTSYSILRYLTTKIGGRLAGSPQSLKAIQWAEQLMRGMKLDTVFLQECKVRHWVRGEKEVARVISGKTSLNLHVCALGGSIGTGKNGITAGVIEIRDYDELKKLGKDKVAGKIVFINHPADPTFYNTFGSYGGTAGYRVRGAVQAAYYGAIAMIDRSATPVHDNNPHTGIQHYADTVKKIPALSISTNDADKLSLLLRSDPELHIFVRTTCEELPETVSYNVIGEIRGAIHPEEIIAFGGHIDSWELGQGAHDDGAGLIESIDILRLYRSLGIKPAHTIRAVAFIDEEMEQRGAKAYVAASLLPQDGMNKVVHIAAIEADRGGFTPWGFSIDASNEQLKKVQGWKNLLLPYGLYSLEKGGSGVDVGPLKSQKVPLFGLVVDPQRYFDYHHSATDTFDKVNIRELQLGTAAMAALVYLIDTYGL